MSVSAQSHATLLNSNNVFFISSCWFSVQSALASVSPVLCTNENFRTFVCNLASNSVFLTGVFMPSDGFSEATAQVCSWAGKNRCISNGSFRMMPATVSKKTISSCSYGEALPAALLQ